MKASAATLFASLLFSPAFAWPAEITSSRTLGTTVIVVKGKIEMGDQFKFESAAHGLTSGIVLLNSDGGSLQAGIGIGRAIRRRGLSTWVSSLQGRCASACGFAWLAGTPRMLDGRAQIGFHAVSTKTNGKIEITAAGNALAGGYMREIGLSDSVIEYATTAGPNSIRWLTSADALRIGLPVEYINVNKLVADPVDSQTLALKKVKTIRVRPDPNTGMLRLFERSDD